MEKHWIVLPIFGTMRAKKKLSPKFGDWGLSLGVNSMNNIISKNTELIKHFWLYFWISGAGEEWIEYNLPIPTIHKHINNGYFVGWAIDGYFGTKKGQEFLNDIIARFLLTFHDTGIKRLPFKPSKKDLDEQTARIYTKVYKLREFSKQLDSLPTKKLYTPTRADSFEDFTFWAIKLYAEDQIRATGFIVYDSLESWASMQFLENKERSTIRAKCRSVWNWYNDRDFELSNSQEKKYNNLEHYLEETMASRAENMKRVSRNKAERNKRAVINVMTGLYADDYKKKNANWHFGKIGEATNLSAKTVAKIIKEIEAEQSI